MIVPKKFIRQYQDLVADHKGEHISDAQAEEELLEFTNLLRLFVESKERGRCYGKKS